MGQDEKICRLCLQIIGEDLPYSALTNNNVVLKNLNLISFNTVRNLDLTEDPLVCNLCEQKLKELGSFKETVIANEFKIQCNQKTDLNRFLRSLSDDVNAICRLCLKRKEKLQKNWLDRKKMFMQCNIHMNVNISMPATICSVCDVTLRTMGDFISLCSDSENLIADFASKKGGNLTSRDLFAISSAKPGSSEKNKTVDNNNVSQNEVKKEMDSLANESERSSRDKSGSKKKLEAASTSGKQSNSIIRYMTKNVKEGLDILKAKETRAVNFKATSEEEKESFNITKTPNKYKNKRASKKFSPATEMPSTSKGDQSISILTNRKYILKKMNEQLRQMHTSIDTSLPDLADITLDVDTAIMVREEPSSEYNVTQELIDVLEGRLNDKEINYATQELLDILEGTVSDDEGQIGNKTVVTVEKEPKSKTEKGGKGSKIETVIDLNVKKSPQKRTYSRRLNAKPPNNATTAAGKKQVKMIEVITISNSGPNKTVSKPDKAKGPSDSKAPGKKQGLKQKTIVTSFKDILSKNNKDVRNNEEISTVNEAPAVKKTVKRTKKIDTDADKAEKEVGKTADTAIAPKKKATYAKKRSNKTSENEIETSPPKKKVRKAPQKKETVQDSTKSLSEIKTEIVSDPTTSESSAPQATNSVTKSDVPLSTNEASGVSKESSAASEDDDEFDEEIQKKLENRPVTVTIIKGKKRSKKAELDKTWEKLTGRPVAEGNSIDNSVAKSIGNVVLGGELEIQVVKKKKGRPRLPAHLKKATRPKKAVIWMRCALCPFKTYAQNSYIQHQLIHNVMSGAEMLQCNVCVFTTSNRELMQQHMLTHASPNLSFKCVFCEEMFRKKTSCMYHTLKHDDQDVASQFYCMVYNAATDEEYFECYQCDYQNVEESPMPDHVIDHTVEKPKNPIIAKFKCNECPYRTKTEMMLKRHMDLHEQRKKGQKKKTEQATGKDSKTTTGQKSALLLIKGESGEVSLIENEEEAILKCDQCHYLTRNKRSLANHKGLKHNRAIPPPVQGQANAAEAMKDDRPIYYCNECSYSTYRKLNLPRHTLIHRTKENMEFLECPHCIFETKHRRSYTRHMEAIHGVVV